MKLSGEGFGHSGKSGISIDETLSIARQAQRVVQTLDDFFDGEHRYPGGGQLEGERDSV